MHSHRTNKKKLCIQTTISGSDSDDDNTEHTGLITKEKAESGSVKLSVILAYCQACAWPMTVITVITYIFAQGTSIGSNFWLAKWSNAQENEQANVKNESVVLSNDSANESNV